MKWIRNEIQSIIKTLILTFLLIFINGKINFILLFAFGYYILNKVLDSYLKRRYKNEVS